MGTDEAKKTKDVALPMPGNNILRMNEKADGTLEPMGVGHLDPLVEGQPVHGEVVSLTRRGNTPLYDFETVVENPNAPRPKPQSAGPPKVATQAYRDNWETIFGKGSDTVN